MACTACEKKKSLAKKLANIVEGHYRVLVPSENAEELATFREPICNGCEFKVALLKVGKQQRYKCGICDCPVRAKVRVSDEQCPKGKW